MEIDLILHNIRSVHNVASIFRTADGAGVSKIYLVGVTPTPLDRFGKFRGDFSKVALGAEKIVPWEHVKSFAGVYKKLKNSSASSGGYEILAVEQDKRSIPYYKWKAKSGKRKVKKEEEKVALIFGKETKGLPKSVLDKADKILEIPMVGSKESLNVSVAAGIVIYSLVHRC